MKMKRILILLLALVTIVQADPHRRYKRTPHRHPNYRRVHHPYHYNYFQFSYRTPRYYTPLVVTSTTTTVYPKNLVLLSAEMVAEDIKALNSLYMRNLITENDFERSKKTLLNRIGMSVNLDAAMLSTPEIIDQIELLYEMKVNELLTEREYRKQKNKLLGMI